VKLGFCDATLLFLCVLLLATSAYCSDIVLVNSDSVGSFLTGTATANRSIVLRQRSAFLDVDALCNAQRVESIELQLFNDTTLHALQTKMQRGRNGALLWTGKLAGVENGQIVLVARDRKISASIYLPSATFQIRPLESGIHLIRELKSFPAFSDNRPATLLPEESRIIDLVNLERATQGLPALQYNDKLAAAARDHAQDMALRDYNSHDRRDGRRFYQCVFDSGYPVSKCGENIAVGLATPEEAFESLISSSEHRSNIMYSDFTQMGVGYAFSPVSTFRHYWTQDFGAGDKLAWTPGLGLELKHSPMKLLTSVAQTPFAHNAPGALAP